MDQITSHFFPVFDDKLVPTFKLQPVLDYHFDSTPRWKQGVIAQDSREDAGIKKYFALADMDHIEGIFSFEGTDLDAHAFEILPVDRPVRPYFDLEWDEEQLPEVDAVLEQFIGAVSVCLSQVGFTTGKGISIYTASGPCGTRVIPSGKKASFHVLFDTLEVFPNVATHKRFVDRVLIPYLSHMTVSLSWMTVNHRRLYIVDVTPYGKNQAFRLPYQSKYVSHTSRPFIGYELKDMPVSVIHTVGIYSNPSALTFISMEGEDSRPKHDGMHSVLLGAGVESSEFAKVVDLCECLSLDFLRGYETARNLVWMLWAVEQTQRMRDWIHTMCRRAENYSSKWVEDLIRGFKFSGFTIGSLVKWARDGCGSNCNKVEEIIDKYRGIYHQELFSTAMKPVNTEVIHQRYLDDLRFRDKEDTLLIKSQLGTGKTNAITNLIRMGHYPRILIISPRKTYTHSQMGEFANDDTGLLPKLESYLDHTGPLHRLDYLIIQVESLYRVGSWFTPYDLVIMDESESILNQMHSIRTHDENMLNNHQVLEKIMQTAGQVILADAFMTDRTFHFVKELRGGGGDRVRYVENTFQPYERKAVQLVTDGDQTQAFYDRIMAALDAGKKVVVVWTSKKVGEEFVTSRLEGKGISWKYYHSENTKEEQLGLRDVEKTWANVRCLMMTTTITVGISYNPMMDEVEFDEAFLYGSNVTAVPRDVAQALLRVRVLKANQLTYVTNLSTYAVEECGFTNVCTQISTKETRLQQDHPLAKWTLCPSWAKWNFVWNENERRCSCAYYKEVLEKYLTLSGYELTEEIVTDMQAIIVEPVVEKKEEKEETSWEKILDMSPTQAEEIRDQMRRGDTAGLSPKVYLQYKKHVFSQKFTEECEDDDKKRYWETFLDHMEQFWNVVKEKRWSLAETVRWEAKKRYAIMSSESIQQREALERFLHLVGMSHSQEEITLDMGALEKLGPMLEAEEKGLREGMGLRASRRKEGGWKITHTIDLIRVILGEWGRSVVESEVKQSKAGGVKHRIYTVYINRNNKLWDHLKKTNTIDDTFSFSFPSLQNSFTPSEGTLLCYFNKQREMSNEL